MFKKNLGFTLIELMIVVVIIAVIASISYPSYTQYVRKSHRIDVQNQLMELAQVLERQYTLTNEYTGAALSAANDRYTINDTVNSQDYTLTAVPRASEGQDKEPCGTLELKHTGERTYTGSGSDCW